MNDLCIRLGDADIWVGKKPGEKIQLRLEHRDGRSQSEVFWLTPEDAERLEAALGFIRSLA